MNEQDKRRQQAEEILRKRAASTPEDHDATSPIEQQQLLHELQVHQIELEMQNEELRRTQDSLEKAHGHYFYLYELAPVGYLTIDEHGTIQEANLTATSLLGVAPSSLAKQLFTRFVLKEDQDIYYLLHKQVVDNESLQTCDLRMVKKDGTVFWGHLAVTCSPDVDGALICRVVLSDITERKLAEDEMLHSEHKFSATISQSMDGILIADGDSRIIEWNDAQTAIFGRSRAEMLGQRLWDFQFAILPDEDRTPERLQQLGERILDFSSAPSSEFLRSRLEYVAQMKDGQRKNIEASVFQINIQNVTLWGAISRDVTERKRAEEALLQSEAQYRLLAENMSDTVWLLDTNLHTIYSSPSVTRLHGNTLEEINSIPLGQQMTAESFQLAMTVFAEALSPINLESPHPRLNYMLELEFCRKDGSHFWTENSVTVVCDQAGRPINILGSGRDITERKRIEDELRQSEEKFRSLFEQSHDGIAILNDADEFLDVNDAYCQMLGYTHDELLHMKVPDVMAPEFRGEPGTVIRSELTRGGKVFETADLHRDGHRIPIEVTITLLKGSNLAVGIVRDITERKQAEVSLRHSEEQYRLLAENMTDTLWLMEPNLHSIYISPSVTRLHGYTLDDFNQVPLAQHMTADSYQRALALFHRATSDENLERPHPRLTNSGEYEFICKDGSRYWSEVTFKLILDQSGKLINILASGRDITERKRAQDITIEEQNLNKAIIEGIPGAFYMLEEHGCYVRWNAYQRDAIVGKPNDQMAETNAIDTIYPDDRPLIQSSIENVLRNGSVEIVEGRVLLRGGPAYRWLVLSGRRMIIAGHPFLVGIGIDISERKQAEDALLERNAELERFNNVTVDRELRMIELKQEINALLQASGQSSKFKIINESD